MRIQTYSGKQFWPLNPTAESVDLVDIAHALSMKCRFNGHCDPFYSVAEHCVRMVQAARLMNGWHAGTGEAERRRLALVLLHDAAEAYLPDVPRPIKSALQNFEGLEAIVHRCILQALGLVPGDGEVKRAFDSDLSRTQEVIDLLDGQLLATEARDLMSEPPQPWDALPPPLPDRIQPWDQIKAKREYLRTAETLGVRRSAQRAS